MMNRVAVLVVAAGVLLPSLSWAQGVDHNDWTTEIAAQPGEVEFGFGFSNDNRLFATVSGPSYDQLKKGHAAPVVARVFGAADGKSRSPAIRTGLQRFLRVAVTDDGGLLAVGGVIGGKLQLALFDAATGAPFATFKIDKDIRLSSTRWCGLAFDNQGKLFACARVSFRKGTSTTQLFTFAVPGLELQGTPVNIAGGTAITYHSSDNGEVGAVFDVGAKNSFRYVPARKEIVYLVEYCCDGGKRFEVAGFNPARQQVTTYVQSRYRDEKYDSVVGLGVADQDLVYLYHENDRRNPGRGYSESVLTPTNVDGTPIGKALGLGTVAAYFHEPGLMIDLAGRVRARGPDGFFVFPGFGKVKGDASKQWKYAERAAFGFEPDTHRLVRLASSEWVGSKPFPPAFIAASAHFDKAGRLAAAGFSDVAKPEVEASIASDAKYVRMMPGKILDFWMKWDTPAAEVGRWMLSSINTPTSTSEDPTDAQFYMLFGLLAAANGHPAVALQAAQMVPHVYRPTDPAEQAFVAMYIAMLEASALAANGDMKGALGKLVQHREALQRSRVRNWFYWYPELFAYLHAAEPRQMAYILDKKENDLPKIPAPRAPAPFVDLNGAPVSVGIVETTLAPAPTKQAAPSAAMPAGKVLD